MSAQDGRKRWHAQIISLGVLMGLVMTTPARADNPAAAELLTKALHTEQTGGAVAATAAYLELLRWAVDSAATAPNQRDRLAVALVALDALTSGHYPESLPAKMEQALAYRIPRGVETLTAQLAQLYPRAAGPFLRSELAIALARLSSYAGDTAATMKWLAATGDVPAAAVVGPLSWPALPVLGRPIPVTLSRGPLAAQYAGSSPFAPWTPLTSVTAREQTLPIGRTNHWDGLVVAMVDVELPRAQTIGIALTSAQAAVVTIGEKPVLTRAPSLGNSTVTRYALAGVSAGRVRVIVQVAKQGINDTLRLRLLDQEGRPLPTRVPTVGEVAPGSAARSTSIDWAEPAPGRPELLGNLARLVSGEAQPVEHLLERAELMGDPETPPALLLLLARALDAAGDLPPYRRRDLQRTAYERVLTAWPHAWEAVVGRARQLGAQREAAEGTVQTLHELEQGQKGADPLVAVFLATVAADAGYRDLALQALQQGVAPLTDSALQAELAVWLTQRAGDERSELLCQTPHLNRSSLTCLYERRSHGDFTGALEELVRLRELLGSPLPLTTFNLNLARGDAAGALAQYDALLPADKNLGTLGFFQSKTSAAELRQRLYRDAPAAQDAPDTLAELLSGGSEPGEEGERLVREDRARPQLPNAATAVLGHRERYELTEAGVLSIRLYDLRRVATVSEVDAGAPLAMPTIDGRSATRIIRRRIFKPDGRIIESERGTQTAQRNTDLPQLESGDYVESIGQVFALPNDSGQLVLDTPDLLPERTSVALATIELSVPARLPLATWSHPLLGPPEEQTAGELRIKRWTLRNAGPRRMERQVPLKDRDVAISIGTLTWKQVGQALARALIELDDGDPVVTAWIRSVARSGNPADVPPAALVGRVIEAIGKRVPFGVSMDDSGTATPWRARTALETGTGSRSWLLYYALRTLGLRAELVLAESQAFSSAAAFPAHLRRFTHSLIIVHLPSGDLWVDPDVSGPPLPPGRVSVELRGRLALRPSGEMIPIAASFVDAGDAAALTLKLDERGDASGSCSIDLQGRPAQLLAESFAHLAGDARRNVLRQVVLSWFPLADVDEVTLSSKEGSWDLQLQAKLTIPGFAQKEGDAWLLPGLEPIHGGPGRGLLRARYASQGGRKNALAINSAMQYRIHRRVQLPTSWLVRTGPEFDVKEASIQASRKGRVGAWGIEEDFTISLPTGTIPLEQYAHFVATLQRIDNAFLATTSAQLRN